MAKLSSDVPLSNGSQLGLSSNGIGGSGSSSAHMNGNAGGAGGGSGADAGGGGDAVAGKLYTELPETSFTRSISNPEAVMRRRRQQKLEKKLQQFRSRDGGPDTGGTLKIYGESLCQDVPYKTLLLSIRDCAQAVVREMLTKYGLEKADPLHYCLVQVGKRVLNRSKGVLANVLSDLFCRLTAMEPSTYLTTMSARYRYS